MPDPSLNEIALEYWSTSRRLLRRPRPDLERLRPQRVILNNLAVIHYGTALGRAAEGSLMAAYYRAGLTLRPHPDQARMGIYGEKEI